MKSNFLFRGLRVGLLAIVLAFTATCGGEDGKTAITVGSKDFTEQFILGEMYVLALENAGFTVKRKLNLGGTPVAQKAMENGEIDLYPEYTGTGLLTVLKLPLEKDPRKVFELVSQAYLKKFNFVWLDPAPMNNTQAFAMTRKVASELGIKTISDMAAKADQITLIGPPEFAQREDGLPNLKKDYGNFKLKRYVSVDAGLRYRGLVEGEANLAVAFGTDGEISAYNLLLLEDDKGIYPPYQVAPVVRAQTLKANLKIQSVLNTISGRLTNTVMQRLNNEVSGKQREPADVAKEFLTQEGLLTK